MSQDYVPPTDHESSSRKRNAPRVEDSEGKHPSNLTGSLQIGSQILDGKSLRGRGNSHVRADAINRMQQTLGNRAVQRSLYHSTSPSAGHLRPVQRAYVNPVVTEEPPLQHVVEGSSSPYVNPVAMDLSPYKNDDASIAQAAAAPIAPQAPQYSDQQQALLDAKDRRQAELRQRQQDNPSQLKTKQIDTGYDTEVIKNPHFRDARTKYITSDEELGKHSVQVDAQSGRLLQGNKALDTGEAAGMAQGSQGGYIYAMSPQGSIYAADMEKQTTEGENGEQAERFHHSSFLAGTEVAGAGEIRTNKGYLSEINNVSGHYRPDAEYTKQTLDQLQASGAAIDQARVHMAKSEETAAVGEFMQAEGNEETISKRHNVAHTASRAVRGVDANAVPTYGETSASAHAAGIKGGAAAPRNDPSAKPAVFARAQAFYKQAETEAAARAAQHTTKHADPQYQPLEVRQGAVTMAGSEDNILAPAENYRAQIGEEQSIP